MCAEGDAGRDRRIDESGARTRAERTRRTMLELLREGPMSGVELLARLGPDASISVVNYHLSVLVNDREIVSEDGLYRLA